MVSEISLRCSPDNMQAFMSVPSVLPVKPSMNILQTLLKRNRIVFGIDDSVLTDIASGVLSGNDLPVAQGKPMRPGYDARIDWFVAIRNTGKPRELKGGNVDHRDLQTAVNVRKGMKLARIVPAVPGTAGLTVTGEVVQPSPVSDLTVDVGEGVTNDNGSLIAERDGSVHFDGKTLSVADQKTINGDIDYATGNVVFCGRMTINGTVRSGFKVDCSGDLHITGDVEDAEIRCDGSVTIAGAALGAVRGTIESAGSIKIKHVGHFVLTSGKNIEVEEDVVNSSVIADGMVTARKILGGMVHACAITVVTAGGTEKVTTTLDITRIQHLRNERYDLLRKYGMVIAERKEYLDGMFGIVRSGMDARGFLPENDQNTLATLKNNTLSSSIQLDVIQTRLDVIGEIEQHRNDNSILRAGRVFPGVVVKSTGEERLIEAEEQNIFVVSRNI